MPAESCVRCGVNMSATEHASLSDESGVKRTESITQDAQNHNNKMAQELLDKWGTKITGEDLAKISIEHSRHIKNILGSWIYSKKSPETTKCEHRCPRGKNGRIPGTSAYGEMILNDDNKKEKVGCCMNVTEGDTETYANCHKKLFFCNLYCPFTNFEKYANCDSGKLLKPGWTNPVTFHGSGAVGDMKIVIADHIKGNWHFFWEAVYLHSEGRKSSVAGPPVYSDLSFMLNFRCALDLAIFHAMSNYQVDKDNVPVDCEINNFIIQNGKKFTNAMNFLQTDKCIWLPKNLTYEQLMNIQNRKLEICTSTYKFGVTVQKEVEKEVQEKIIAMYTEPMNFDQNTQCVRKRYSSKKVKNKEPTATTETAQNSDVSSAPDSSCVVNSVSSFEIPAAGAVSQSIVSPPDINEIQTVESQLKKIEEEKHKSHNHVFKISQEYQNMLHETKKKFTEYQEKFKCHNDMIPTWEEGANSLRDKLESLKSSKHKRMEEEASKESVQDSIPSAENPEIEVLQDTEQIVSEDSASNSTPCASNRTPSADNTATRVREDDKILMPEENSHKRPRLSVQSDVGASGKISLVDSLTNVLSSKSKKSSADVQSSSDVQSSADVQSSSDVQSSADVQSSSDVQSSADVQGHEMSNADESISDAAQVLLSLYQ